MNSKADITFRISDLVDLMGKTKQAIQHRARREGWPYVNGNGKGGAHRLYPLVSLPGDIQARYISSIYRSTTTDDTIMQGRIAGMIDALAPEAISAVRDALMPAPIPTFAATVRPAALPTHWDDPATTISIDDLRDPRVKKILGILREADRPPRTWGKGRRKWVEMVALKHDVTWQSIYRWQKQYEKKGIAGICHRKSTKGQAVGWDKAALEWWLSVALKREHRKMDLRDLYDFLIIEAHEKGWKIGGYASAVQWYKKKATPTLRAMQNGGLRALDNLLPPVLRDYSDLAPFEMLVGDQHRWDFWVVDDETGQVFRPESYLWQDLRTRVIYGAATDHRYDASLCGLALRIGVEIFGLFTSIYTDNGRPELSKYMMGIMADLRALGATWSRTLDEHMDTAAMDAECVTPAVIEPGTHKKAIVKNAKAKMIEGTFDILEEIMRSHFRLPGSVKRLCDDIHAQDIDHHEAQRLAEQGRLPLFSEFVLTQYRALDYYNREKAHRGVLKEWIWRPKPTTATPYDCLQQCYERDGWRPRMITTQAADLIFLHKARRAVYKGRVQLLNDYYEAPALVEMEQGGRVDIRYNPWDTRQIYIFQGSEFIATAWPVEYSSMKDASLAQRKIKQKRELRARIAEQFRAITSHAPDFREYSQVDVIERASRLITEERTVRDAELAELNRIRTPEELEAEARDQVALGRIPTKTRRPLPERPMYFADDMTRYEWCVSYELAGGELDDDDRAWKAARDAEMDDNERRYWDAVRECGGM